MFKKRIVILGDSLGMPRPDEQPPVEYEETYPYLLKQLLPEWEVLSACKRANHATKQGCTQYLYDDIIFIKPTAVVIHLGVVDCAPRLFNNYEKIILNKMPSVIRNKIIAFFSKHRKFFTRRFKKVYVNKKDFEKNIDKLIKTALESKATPILIGIADTNHENKEKSYGFSQNIIDYNAILLALAERHKIAFINMYDKGDKILLSDGIHLQPESHKLIANEIYKAIY